MCGYRARCSLSAAAKPRTSTSKIVVCTRGGTVPLTNKKFQLYSAVLDRSVTNCASEGASRKYNAQ